MITKNEADKLKKCLSSIKKYGFEIVVVDTGSTDNTMEIIAKYADIHGEFEWCDNFAVARNYSVSLANNDIVLVLDTDEWVEKCDLSFVSIFRNESYDNLKIGRIERINDIISTEGIEKGKERISRIFDRRFFEYRGRIHEQVVLKETKHADKLCDYELIDVPITIGHSGYSDSIQNKEKAQRNIRLLNEDIEEYGKDPYILYQLGKSYYMQKDYENSSRYFEDGLGFDLDPKLEYVQDMVETYGYCLLQLKRYDEMLFLREIYNEFAVSADYVFLMGLAYMNNCMYEEAIKEFEKATTFNYCKVQGCNSFKALYNAGVILECLDRKKEAYNYYIKCGNYTPAINGIERIKAEK